MKTYFFLFKHPSEIFAFERSFKAYDYSEAKRLALDYAKEQGVEYLKWTNVIEAPDLADTIR